MAFQGESVQTPLTPIEAINRSRKIFKKLGWNITLDRPDNLIIQARIPASAKSSGELFTVLVEKRDGQTCLYIESSMLYQVIDLGKKNMENINDFLRESNM